MSKSIFSKIAAVVCSTSTMLALSVTVGAVKMVEPVSDYDGIESGITNIVGAHVYAEPGEVVEYEVHLVNNTGIAQGGFGIHYPAGLKPVMDLEGEDPTIIKMGGGPAGDSLMQMFSSNLADDERIAGVAMMSPTQAGDKDDGMFCYATFEVPKEATPGTIYKMEIQVNAWKTYFNDPIPYHAIDGWIEVVGPETTTTTTATTPAPTTTTTAPVTSTTNPPATTPNPGTTTAPITTVSGGDVTTTAQVTTVSGGNGDETGDATTTTTTAAPTPAPGTTTPAPAAPTPGTTTKAPAQSATKTGDAGVGVAAAALLLAAGSAVVASTKKKED